MRHEKSDIGPYGVVPQWVLRRHKATAAIVWTYLSTWVNQDGQCWPRVQKIADDLSLHAGTVRVALKELEGTGALIVQHTMDERGQGPNLYFLVFVDPEINRYQGPLPFDSAGVPPLAPALDPPSADARPPSCQRDPPPSAGASALNKDRTKPVELEKTSPSGESKKSAGNDAWARFRQTYPKRSGDCKASKAASIFQKHVDRGVSPDTMIEGASRYAAWCAWTGKVGTELVQQMTTWLNGSAWENAWEMPSDAPPEPDAVRFRKEPLRGVDFYERGNVYGPCSDKCPFAKTFDHDLPCPNDGTAGCKGQRIGPAKWKLGPNGEKLEERFKLKEWKAARGVVA